MEDFACVHDLGANEVDQPTLTDYTQIARIGPWLIHPRLNSPDKRQPQCKLVPSRFQSCLGWTLRMRTQG